ncbi:DUF1176 domain-containing protein [Labrys wisconsinensis]|uniref:DUF1176 domain-containing protein n=1 Tax=Labrys wisconsinensis TaxID=425677 RepID=A0ABU0JA73_9HYPH|nr:DUF1176 domain-containing protein [Labrys wisconsinensis]MDQ0470520.1 hypothetical protein [Labrys wisconsinensis]
MTAVRPLGFLLLPALLLASAGAAPASALKSFKAWLAGCDNTLACRALGTVGEDSGDILYLVLDRPGGPQAAPTLRFMDQDGAIGAKGLAYSLDGAAPVEIPASAFSALPKTDPDAAAEVALSGTAATDLIAAIRNGRTLRFGAGAPLPTDGLPVSLDGMAAALLFIDDVQGRVGTVTALARKGDKPAAAVPPAPAAPLIAAVHPPKAAADAADAPAPKALIARHVRETKAGECQDIDQEKDVVSSAQRLSDQETLYQIGCWRAAYQSGAMLYLGVPSAPAAARRLVFETLDEATGKIAARLASPTDPSEVDEAGVMASFHKGRGIGDCGASWSWAWTGRDFRLASYTSMPECRGIAADDWITLWQARTK